MTYPKWVQRAPYIGAVLCLNEEEETQLLADWEAQQNQAPEVDDPTNDQVGDTLKPKAKPGPKPKAK